MSDSDYKRQADDMIADKAKEQDKQRDDESLAAPEDLNEAGECGYK